MCYSFIALLLKLYLGGRKSPKNADLSAQFLRSFTEINIFDTSFFVDYFSFKVDVVNIQKYIQQFTNQFRAVNNALLSTQKCLLS